MLTSQPDNKNVWIRHNDHIPCSSSSICHCLRLRLRCSLVLRQAPRIYLAHCHTDHNLCRGLQHPHQHPQCRSAVFWNHPANQRYVQRTQSSTVLGNNSGSFASSKKGRSDCHCQLYQSVEPLVQPLLLPNKPGTILSYGWRVGTNGVCACGTLCLCGQLARQETQQEIR